MAVASLLAGALSVLVIGGCKSYHRKPLDLAATREAFAARDAGAGTARAFAERLARAEGVAPAFDPADGLTLAEAEPVALLFNRDLRLARLEADVARATADNAGLWDDPVLGVDVERIVSGVPDPWVVAGTLGLTIPISGRLAAEKARAGAEYEAELHRLAAREWATRSGLRELWIEWSAQVTRTELVTELSEQLRTVSDLAQRQERAGVLSRIDERLFRVELGGAEAEVIAARARARELELQLRDLLGLTPEAPLQLVRTVVFPPRSTDAAFLRASLEMDNPELAAVRQEYEVAEKSLRLEVRRQYPDLAIGPGFGTDEGDERVLLGVQLPVPLWNRNRQGVAEATARREAARGRFESGYEHLVSRLAIALSRYEAGRAMREAIETRVLPLADEQDAEVRRVAELGRVDPLLLLESVKSRHEAKTRLLDARAAESIGAVRLDELIGPPIASREAGKTDSAPASPARGPQTRFNGFGGSGPPEGGRP